ncbi:3-hydroxyacyl-CoA dehydrogenase [uncultured Bradyrhizobium sp.]|uniref:3-hydroxyacyl-CoA dehydrogenase n=1 Tax=uncultured Bradyrhizobium sp. TaxID=199684 RepID=UPI002601E48F|nr:3-hydroxyacyl-CoA dehydrogenase [uncultured Bradyrhizobium sp.]
MNKITVAGSGVLGSQIAFQTAYHGYAVALYDISDAVLEKARAKLTSLGKHYETDIGATQSDINAAMERITMTADLGTALADADLLIEAIPELIAIKMEFYGRAGSLAPAKTIFATNTSTLLPSQLADATGRSARFLALHFANEIWKRNIAEVMGHAGTDRDAFDAVIAFAKSIGMVALPIHKEQPGYLTNSVLIPWIIASLKLWADDVADFKTIDRSWRIGSGSTFVPFAVMDMVGLNTAHNTFSTMAEAQKDQLLAKVAQRLKAEFIDKGKLGVAAGEGFYKYPDPEFLAPGFLS